MLTLGYRYILATHEKCMYFPYIYTIIKDSFYITNTNAVKNVIINIILSNLSWNVSVLTAVIISCYKICIQIYS